MAAGRALFTARLLASGAARDETLPRQIPASLRPLLRPMTWLGVRWFANKYALATYDPVRALEELRRLFDSVRAKLGGGDYLLGSFSYADILGAVALGIWPEQPGSAVLGAFHRAQGSGITRREVTFSRATSSSCRRS